MQVILSRAFGKGQDHEGRTLDHSNENMNRNADRDVDNRDRHMSKVVGVGVVR